jgi:hypothetical protein
MNLDIRYLGVLKTEEKKNRQIDLLIVSLIQMTFLELTSLNL